MRGISHIIDNVKVPKANLMSDDVILKLKEYLFIHGWNYPWKEQLMPHF
jgi:hypothetical protein